MICFPNAKINIGLSIVEKRNDGFHNIETVFYPIGLSDILELTIESNQVNDIEFTLSGIKIEGEMESNLCVKAYRLIAKDYPLPKIKIHLHKIIPAGAGLGGGSSDAAFFIRAINDLADLGLSFGELHHYARLLGSDCSFFINNKASLGTGKGDELEGISLSLDTKYMVLVKPQISVSTQEAYQLVSPKMPAVSLQEQIQLPIERWKNSIVNDFENSVFAKYPSLEEIKKTLYSLGATYASMSGSGSSVYGIFDSEINITSHFKNHFVWQGTMKI